MKNLNPLYFDRLKEIVPENFFGEVMQSHSAVPGLCIRVNPLRISEEYVLNYLQQKGIKYSFIPSLPLAWVVEGISSKDLSETDLIKKGYIYIQNPSSMLSVLILDPQPGERILDMCAAPGSKATQIAAQMHNQGKLICLENIRKRYYKLKAVAELMGAEIIQSKIVDGRRYRDQELFDRILLDAPCSCEGRIKTYAEKSFAYWSLRKIREMRHKQKGLILNAGRLLKPGGVLVYVTCTFAPEENEEVINWFLRKTDGTFAVQPLALNKILTYPPLTERQGKSFHSQIAHCVRILPRGFWDGFFIAKLKKII